MVQTFALNRKDGTTEYFVLLSDYKRDMQELSDKLEAFESSANALMAESIRALEEKYISILSGE